MKLNTRRNIRFVAFATLLTQVLGLGSGIAQTIQVPALSPSPASVPAVKPSPLAVPKPVSAPALNAPVLRQAGQVVNQIHPVLGKEIQLLEKQINGLVKGVGAFEKNLKPVMKNATLAVGLIESYPQQVDAFKTKYNIPKNIRVR